MKIYFFVVLIFITSCASSNNRGEKRISDIKEEDFKNVPKKYFNSKYDYFDQNIDASFVSFSEETQAFSNGKAANAESPTAIASLCYEGKVDKAFSLASDSLNIYRKHPHYWTAIGNCYLAQNDLYKAILYYNKALDIIQNYAPALNNLGVIYLKQGDDQKALVAFKKALSYKRKQMTVPSYNLAILYIRYGLLEKAENLLSSINRNHPQDRLIASAYIATLKGSGKNDLRQRLCQQNSSYFGKDDAMKENCK